MDFIMPTPNRGYKVVIICPTYNQENFIEDALKGFVRQKTDFDFCAVIIDDCSTDKNPEIIKRYEEDYPGIVRGIYLPVNMYGNPEKLKYFQPWLDCAQYVAFCDGDDYWIDDYKLQRQVDFLDTHPDYTMYFHNAIIRYQDREMPDRVLSNFVTGDFNTEQLFKKWQLPLASILIRSSILHSAEYRKLSKNVHGGFLFFLTAMKTGKVYGLSQCLSVYRKNAGGVSNGMTPAFCLQVESSYAMASEDVGAISFMKRKAANAVGSRLPKILIKDKSSIELAKIAHNFDRFVYFKAIFYYLFLILPIRLIKKLRGR